MSGRAARSLRASLLRGLLALRADPLEVRPGSVLVVAPHPDDEVFGCGGLIARHRGACSAVSVVYLTDGGASHRSCCGASPEVVGPRRRAAAARACTALGVGPGGLHWLGLRDAAIPARGTAGFEEAAAALATLARPLRPSLVLAPSPLDGWPDHQAAAQIVDAAFADAIGDRVLLRYPVWMWRNLPISRWALLRGQQAFVADVSGQREQVRNAMDVYRQDHLPGCDVPSCGRLPAGVADGPPAAREYFFGG